MKYTPEGLPRIKSYFEYGQQFYFEPRLYYHFQRKKWQLYYNDGREAFHYAFNLSCWEGDTIEEAVKKGAEYFKNTKHKDMYHFQFHK